MDLKEYKICSKCFNIIREEGHQCSQKYENYKLIDVKTAYREGISAKVIFYLFSEEKKELAKVSFIFENEKKTKINIFAPETEKKIKIEKQKDLFTFTLPSNLSFWKKEICKEKITLKPNKNIVLTKKIFKFYHPYAKKPQYSNYTNCTFTEGKIFVSNTRIDVFSKHSSNSKFSKNLYHFRLFPELHMKSEIIGEIDGKKIRKVSKALFGIDVPSSLLKQKMYNFIFWYLFLKTNPDLEKFYQENFWIFALYGKIYSPYYVIKAFKNPQKFKRKILKNNITKNLKKLKEIPPIPFEIVYNYDYKNLFYKTIREINLSQVKDLKMKNHLISKFFHLAKEYIRVRNDKNVDYETVKKIANGFEVFAKITANYKAMELISRIIGVSVYKVYKSIDNSISSIASYKIFSLLNDLETLNTTLKSFIYSGNAKRKRIKIENFLLKKEKEQYFNFVKSSLNNNLKFYKIVEIILTATTDFIFLYQNKKLNELEIKPRLKNLKNYFEKNLADMYFKLLTKHSDFVQTGIKMKNCIKGYFQTIAENHAVKISDNLYKGVVIVVGHVKDNPKVALELYYEAKTSNNNILEIKKIEVKQAYLSLNRALDTKIAQKVEEYLKKIDPSESWRKSFSKFVKTPKKTMTREENNETLYDDEIFTPF